MVIDRYFETRSQALAWEKSHAHFMKIQIVTPGKAKTVANKMPSSPLVPTTPRPPPPTPRAESILLQPAFLTGDSAFCAFSQSATGILRSARRRTGGDAFFAGLRKGRGPLERLRLSWLETG
jgi:hypothetical protein